MKKLERRALRYNRISYIMIGSAVAIILLVISVFGIALSNKIKYGIDKNTRQGDEQIRILTNQNQELKNQNQDLKKQIGISQQGLEIQTCLLVIDIGPERVKRIFPGASVEKCVERLSGINNADGSFLPREIDDQGTFAKPQTEQPTESPQPQTQNPQSNNQTGALVNLCVPNVICVGAL